MQFAVQYVCCACRARRVGGSACRPVGGMRSLEFDGLQEILLPSPQSQQPLPQQPLPQQPEIRPRRRPVLQGATWRRDIIQTEFCMKKPQFQSLTIDSVCVCVRTCMFAYVFISMCVRICMFVCVCVCMCVCLCVSMCLSV